MCEKRGTECRIQQATMEVSGSSCRPWSRMNRSPHCRGVPHPDYPAFKAWVRIMRHDSPPIIIHENVVGFPLKVMQDELGESYAVTRLSVVPDDAGFGFIRRPRVYDVLFKRGVVSGPALQEVYGVLVQRLRKDVSSLGVEGDAGRADRGTIQSTPTRRIVGRRHLHLAGTSNDGSAEVHHQVFCSVDEGAWQ